MTGGMAPVMMTVEMERLKVRRKIRQVEIAVKTVKMILWLKICLLALVSSATSYFQKEETKQIMKTMCTRKNCNLSNFTFKITILNQERKIPSAKGHTLAKLIQGVERSSPTRLHCGIIS